MHQSCAVGGVILNELEADEFRDRKERDLFIRRRLAQESFDTFDSPDEAVEPAVHAVENDDGGMCVFQGSGDASVGESVGRECGGRGNRGGFRRRSGGDGRATGIVIIGAEDGECAGLAASEEGKVGFLQALDGMTLRVANQDDYLHEAGFGAEL